MSESNDADSTREPGRKSRDSDRETAPSTRRDAAIQRRNWDAYAAVIATLVGLLALLVSGYTASAQRQQLRAQVWPYLIIATSNVPPEVGFHTVNSGTGPARVVGARVTVDGHAVSTWGSAQKLMGSTPGGIIKSDLSHSVLTAGKDAVVIRPFDEATTPRFMELFLGDKHEIVVTVCYCSVLDECWVVGSHDGPSEIGGPGSCPIADADRFQN